MTNNRLVDNDKNLFAPFISINGIGEPTAKIISEHNSQAPKKVFFTRVGVSKVIPGVNKTVIKILKEIKAFSPVTEYTDEERKTVNEIFKGR